MRAVHLLVTLAGLGLGLPAYAADPAPPPRTGEMWNAVSDRTLDAHRGGFDVGGGLMVSFGITRAVYINGDLVTQTTLNFGRLSELTPAQASQLSRQMAAVNLVQIGPGNSVSPDATGAAFGTVIQNTLNNQQITNETVIRAQSNGLGMIKNLNTQTTLNDSLVRAVGGR